MARRPFSLEVGLRAETQGDSCTLVHGDTVCTPNSKRNQGPADGRTDERGVVCAYGGGIGVDKEGSCHVQQPRGRPSRRFR